VLTRTARIRAQRGEIPQRRRRGCATSSNSAAGRDRRTRPLEAVFDGRVPGGTEDDLFALVRRSQADRLPALHGSCGARSIPVTTSFGPGQHDWAYWDERIQDVLAWLPLTRR